MNKIKANILTTELEAPVYEELSDSETINIVGGLSKIPKCRAKGKIGEGVVKIKPGYERHFVDVYPRAISL